MLSIYRRASRQIPGLGYWTLTIGLQCITPLLLLTKISSLPVITYGIFTFLTFLGGIFFYFGLAEFTRTTIKKWYYYALFFLLFFLVLLSFFLSWQNNVRYILVSAGCVVFAGGYLNLLIRNYQKHQAYKSSFFPLILLYIGFGIFHILRIIYLISNARTPTSEILQKAPFFLGTYLFIFSLLLGVNLLILLLISQKLLQDLSIEAEQKNALLDKLKILAEKDGLTGLMNRSTIETSLDQLFTLSAEIRKDLILFFIDIDNFKEINDKYGHEIGDVVLCQLATIFQQFTKKDDRVGRWGGDEFLIIIHRPEGASAKKFADELIETVNSHDWNQVIKTDTLLISISCGFKSLGSVASKRELLRRVDQNLYAAKSKGRNRSEGS